MIDLHCHIIPGFDDGANSVEAALGMARMAVQDGIRYVAATPHHLNGRYINEASLIGPAVERLNAELQAHGIPLHVAAGQEIRYVKRVWSDLDTGNFAALNGSRYLLIELPASHVPEELSEFVYELGVSGYVPVIAHPERNAELADDPAKLAGLVRLGALGQVTAQSLLGGFGRGVQRSAVAMCRMDAIHIVASDAHDTRRRPFGLSAAYSWIERRLGADTADYYKMNAQAIWSNDDVVTRMPQEKKRWLFW